MNPKRVALLIAVLAVIPAAGCGKLAEKVGEKATEKIAEQACKDSAEGEDCEVDISKDGATVKVGDGEFKVGENIDYPDGYPDYLKLDGFNPMQSVLIDEGTLVTLVNPDAGGANSLASLKGQAEGAGCTLDENMSNTASEMGMNTATMNCSDGRVTINSLSAEDESEQIVQVMVGAGE